MQTPANIQDLINEMPRGPERAFIRNFWPDLVADGWDYPSPRVTVPGMPTRRGIDEAAQYLRIHDLGWRLVPTQGGRAVKLVEMEASDAQ